MVARFLLLTLLCLGLSAGPLKAEIGEADLKLAKDNLLKILGDKPEDAQSLRGLRASEDKQLLPILAAMCRGKDKDRQLFAVMSVTDMGGQSVNELMRQCFRDDTLSEIRGAAFNHLISNNACTDEDLAIAIASSDDNLILMAGRELVKRKQFDKAIEPLKTLIGKPDEENASLARMVLLAAGDASQAPELEKVVSAKTTSPWQKLLMMGIVEKDVILQADPVVRKVIASDDTPRVRAIAFRALAALSPEEGVQAIVQELDKRGEDPVLQVQLISGLAPLASGKKALARLKGSASPIVAAMAGFELARADNQDKELAETTRALMRTSHPIVVDYVLAQAAKAPSAAYAPGLLLFINSVPTESRQMLPEHQRAAKATALLVKIAAPEEIKGLEKILAGPYNARSRSVASGLIQAEGEAVARLCQIVLASPYDELVTDAALALGKTGDARAAEPLLQILHHPDRYPPALLSIVSWQLLKIAGQSDAFAKELAGKVR